MKIIESNTQNCLKMKNLIAILFLFSLQNVLIQAQQPFKVRIIDLDTRQLDSVLPIEEPFYLTFKKKDTFDIESFRLFQVHFKQNVFSPSQKIRFYNVRINPISPKGKEMTVETIKLTEKTTITIEDTGRSKKIVKTEDRSIDPIKDKKYNATIFLPQLAPYNYYYILDLKDSSRLKDLKIDSASKKKKNWTELAEKIDMNGSISRDTDINMFKAIYYNSTIPLGNTGFDRLENINRRVTAVFGVTYLSLPNKAILPYAGLRYSIKPINKWIRQGEVQTDPTFDNTVWNRLAIDIGVTFTSIEDTTFKIKNLTGNMNLLTGIGYRISNFAYLSTGCVWYNKTSEADKTKIFLKPSFYFSFSLDWDIGKTFNAFAKLIGFKDIIIN